MTRGRVVVVGAAGFLGRACVAALAQAGLRTDGADIVPVAVPGTGRWFTGDVMADGVPAEALEGADTLIHLVWRNDPGRGNAEMETDVLTNVACAVRTFEQAARAGVQRLIYASSGGTIYGSAQHFPTSEDAPIAPISGYGAGKAAAELYLHAAANAHGIETCALRIANPYGPGQYPDRGQGFIATAIARTLRREPIQVFGTTALSRDYVFIQDVGEAFALACAAPDLPPVLNVGSSSTYSLEELIPLIFAAVGHATEVEHVAARSVDVPRVQLDIGRIQGLLGWTPHTSLEEGLARTVDWIRRDALS